MPNFPPSVDLVSARVGGLRAAIAELRGSPDAVKIVAVTKTFDVSAMDVASLAGCDAVAENYAQELLDKVDHRNVSPRLPVHFIGHLQSNKVKSLFAHVDLWQSVDRESVVDALGREASRCGTTPAVLLQVNATGEPQKSGCSPDELPALAKRACDVGLDVRGLMTMGPSDADPVGTRRGFRTVATLAAELGLSELSMGMTHDVRIGIEEGATMVRIGAGLFGERPRSG